MTKPASLMIDNFTLQDVGSTFLAGLDPEPRVEIFPSSAPAGHEVRTVRPQA
ncbi:MAG: hypothetical protein JWM32_2166 [Verrucomicrobia bacterium]|nr:hypothetical protein [Verrucomicrobiota bacterium]